MTTVYITHQGASVHTRQHNLSIRRDGHADRIVHLFKLKQLVLVGRVTLTSSAIQLLLRNAIDTSFLTWSGFYLGRLQSPHTKNIPLRIQQFQSFCEPNCCLKLANQTVETKILNQRTFLMRLQRSRTGLDLSSAIVRLRRTAAKASTEKCLDALRGHEGHAGNVYFESLRKAISSHWEFHKRTRRPPTDPVNALLSLGYTLLANRAVSVVAAVGFDPFFGFMHQPHYGRPSLALDLIETYRTPVVDQLVLSLIGRRVLKTSDFREETLDDYLEGDPIEGKSTKRAVLLKQASFKKFIAHFEHKLATTVQDPLSNGKKRSYLHLMERDARQLAHCLDDDKRRYEPYRIGG